MEILNVLEILNLFYIFPFVFRDLSEFSHFKPFSCIHMSFFTRDTVTELFLPLNYTRFCRLCRSINYSSLFVYPQKKYLRCDFFDLLPIRINDNVCTTKFTFYLHDCQLFFFQVIFFVCAFLFLLTSFAIFFDYFTLSALPASDLIDPNFSVIVFKFTVM